MDERHGKTAARARWPGLAAGLVIVVVLAAFVAVLGFAARRSGTHDDPTAAAAATTSTTVPSSAGTATRLAAGTWSELPPAPIVPRTDASVVWTGDEMIVFGGEATPDGAAYNPRTKRWRRLPHPPFTVGNGVEAVWTGREMFVYGASLDPERRGTDSGAYDPATDRWRVVPRSPLRAGVHAVLVWSGRRVVVLAGNRAIAYRPSTNEWERLPVPRAPHPPLGWVLAASTGDGRIVAWSQSTGQRGAFAESSGTDVFSFDDDTNTWRTYRRAKDAITNPQHAFASGNRLLVRGDLYWPGSVGPPMPEVGAWFDVGTGTWARLAPDALNANDVSVSGLASAWTGRALWSFNGASQYGIGDLIVLAPGDASVYDPVHDTWRRLARAPFGCGNSSRPVWTGEVVLLYCTPFPNVDHPVGGLQYTPGAATAS